MGELIYGELDTTPKVENDNTNSLENVEKDDTTKGIKVHIVGGACSTLSTTHILGSNLSGSDDTANRTYAAAGTVKLVVVEGKVLHYTKDYTLSGNTITFIMKVRNVFNILIQSV